MAATMWHERLRGSRRAAAGTQWGLVVEFTPVEVPEAPRAEQVNGLTQAWVDIVGASIIAHPTHWHMLQRVFLADLEARPSDGGAR